MENRAAQKPIRSILAAYRDVLIEMEWLGLLVQRDLGSDVFMPFELRGQQNQV